uniref:Guanylate kinase-like domain-containing protein n=1 Tax=Amphilophus citrinellus TaxID=61819 RepID=A0A3Q0QY82_AMPCI
RAQQLLLVRLRKIALEQKDSKKKFSKKSSGRVRLVKAVDPSCRGIGPTQQVLYTLSKHEDHLIPYSLVQPVQVQTKRPVIFSPSLLSCGLIERLLQPAESGLKFNTCQPDKHCLLELGLSSVEGLLRLGIYPIVIHIRPKNKKRKFFPRCGEDNVMEELCQAEELQLETLPILYYTLEPNAWSCTDELLAALRTTIHSQQRAMAWVELD